MMNQIFGYQTLPEDGPSNTSFFEGTELVIPFGNIDINSTQVKLFAGPNTHLQSCFSQHYETYCYVWGIPAHPEIDSADIPKWCIKIAAEKCYNEFKDLVGTFVIIIDEPLQNRLIFVTDILGIRPMFLGKYENRIVFGSDVWSIHQAGLTSGIIDYDAVSSWIAYEYNCTDNSIFTDLRRLPAGSVVEIKNSKYNEFKYTDFKSNYRSESISLEESAEKLHDIICSTVRTLLGSNPRICLALSGGYDCRYLLALSSSFGKSSIKCVTVGSTDAEVQVARQVVTAIDIPLSIHPVHGSIWDLYDQVYHFTADGFPISKFLTHYIAQQYPDLPMMNGFIGDSLIRGFHDKIQGKSETEWKGDLTDVLQSKYTVAGFKLFRKEIANRIQLRTRPPMEKAVRNGMKVGKVFSWTDLHFRQRYYISNNFLQHIGITEALLPFYSWSLINYKMNHDDALFSQNPFKQIFHKHFIHLSQIPHSDDLLSKKAQPSFGNARITKRWARRLLPKLMSKKWLSLLAKKQPILHTIASIGDIHRTEYTILRLQRLYLLEKRLKDAGLNFDWNCI